MVQHTVWLRHNRNKRTGRRQACDGVSGSEEDRVVAHQAAVRVTPHPPWTNRLPAWLVLVLFVLVGTGVEWRAPSTAGRPDNGKWKTTAQQKLLASRQFGGIQGRSAEAAPTQCRRQRRPIRRLGLECTPDGISVDAVLAQFGLDAERSVPLGDPTAQQQLGESVIGLQATFIQPCKHLHDSLCFGTTCQQLALELPARMFATGKQAQRALLSSRFATPSSRGLLGGRSGLAAPSRTDLAARLDPEPDRPPPVFPACTLRHVAACGGDTRGCGGFRRNVGCCFQSVAGVPLSRARSHLRSRHGATRHRHRRPTPVGRSG